jgi:hypothetical protein
VANYPNYSGVSKLTLGNMMLLRFFDNDLYRLIDDSNNNWAFKETFHTLEVHREKIINEIQMKLICKNNEYGTLS